MIFRRAAVVAALLVLAVSPVICSDFTMGRYDASQTSCTNEKLQLPLSLNWEFTGNKYANNSASPIVADGVCYYSCGDRVYAVELETGNQKWRYPSDQGLGSSIRATPAIFDGKVFFGCGDGNLYCLNAQTGVFEWAYQARGAIKCPPVVLDGVIYIGTDDDSIYAIDAETGDAVWNKPITARDDFANGLAISGGVIVGSCMDGITYGINAAFGKPKWMFRMTSSPIRTSPIISNNIAVVATGDIIYGLGAKSGQLRWTINLPIEAAATPSTDGQNIYVLCRDKKMYAYTLMARKPSLKWTQPVDLGFMPESSATIAGDLVYVTGSKGVVAAYSAEDGTLKWRYVIAPSAVNAPNTDFIDASSAPVVANGCLLIVTDDGVLHCFTPNAPDNTTPQAIKMSPVNGIYMSGAPPIKMSAILYDQGSGVDFSSVSMSLDGQTIVHTIDYPTSTVSFVTDTGAEGKSVRALKDGPHTINISVKDYAGNLLNQEWIFNADSSYPPPKIPQKADKKTTKDPSRGPNNRNNQPRGGAPGISGGSSTSPPMPPGMMNMTSPTRKGGHNTPGNNANGGQSGSTGTTGDSNTGEGSGSGNGSSSGGGGAPPPPMPPGGDIPPPPAPPGE